MTPTSNTSPKTKSNTAQSRVTVAHLRLERDDMGRKVAHLRLRQPSSGAVVSATATKPEIIDALFQASRDVLWTAIIDRCEPKNLRVIQMRRA